MNKKCDVKDKPKISIGSTQKEANNKKINVMKFETAQVPVEKLLRKEEKKEHKVGIDEIWQIGKANTSEELEISDCEDDDDMDYDMNKTIWPSMKGLPSVIAALPPPPSTAPLGSTK